MSNLTERFNRIIEASKTHLGSSYVATNFNSLVEAHNHCPRPELHWNSPYQLVYGHSPFLHAKMPARPTAMRKTWNQVRKLISKSRNQQRSAPPSLKPKFTIGDQIYVKRLQKQNPSLTTVEADSGYGVKTPLGYFSYNRCSKRKRRVGEGRL